MENKPESIDTVAELALTDVIPIQDLIVIRQLPVIEDRLRENATRISERVAKAKADAIASGDVQYVKKVRADLNKEFQEADALRKQVSAEAKKPIVQFESTFKECATEIYREADSELKEYIVNDETSAKKACEDGLREYFAELCEVHNVDFLKFSQAGIKVDLTSAKAKTPTKLRNQLETFVIGVACDLRLIEKMDYSTEIIVEYKRNLSVAKSVAAVQERHNQIEQEMRAAEQRQEIQTQEQKIVEHVQSFAPPVAAVKEETLCLTFSVTDTKPRLRLLKQFLDANGYQYE